MAQPHSQSELDRREAGLSPLAGLLVLRSLFIAIGVSLVLHLAFLAAVYFQTGFRPPLRMEFEASAGVGLMSNEGMVPHGASYLELPPEETVDPMAAYEAFEIPDEIELPDPADEDAGDGGTDEDAEAEAAEAARLAEQRALARRAHRDQLRREAQEQALRDRALALRQQRERESAALAEEEARAAEEAAREAAAEEAAEQQAEADDETEEPAPADPGQSAEQPTPERQRPGRDLPPAQRYPEGTLNPIATDVGMWGPESARVVLIMRNDRIRQSPHAESVRLLLSSFPDWNNLLGHTDVDPLTDIDTLMIASSDPRWVNQTFLAAIHRIPPARIVQELEAGFPQGISWRDEQGRLIGTPAPGRYVDPRMFVLPTENLFIYSRPEFLAPLLTGSPTPAGLDAARREAVGAPDDDETGAPAASPGDDASPTTEGGDDEATEPPDDGAATQADAPPSDNEGENDIGESPSGDSAGDGGVVVTPDGSATPDGGPGVALDSERDAPTQGSRPAPVAPPKAEPDQGSRVPAPVVADERPPVRADGWMRGLLELADFGGPGPRGTAVQLTMAGFAGFSLSGLNPGLEPSEIHLSIDASTNPVLQARFVFEDGEQAAAFIRAFPDVLSANRAMLMLSGMNGPLSNISWGVDHNEAIGVTSVSGSTLRRIATTVNRLLGER